MKTVEIEISTEGEVKIEAVNFKGVSCTAATAAFEEALGTVKQRTKKREYHQQSTSQQSQRT